MNTLVLKALADLSLYFAVMMPVIIAVDTPLNICLSALPAAWVVWLVLNWSKRGLRGNLLDTLYFEIRLLAVCVAFEMIFLGISRWAESCVIFVTAFFIFAILAARADRLERDGGEYAAFRRTSFIEIAAVIAVALVLSRKSVYGTVISLARSLYDRVIVPIFETLLNVLLRFFMWISQFLPEFSLSDDREVVELDMETGIPGYEDVETGSTPQWLNVILIVIGIVIAAAVLIYIFRRLSERGRKDTDRTSGEITRSTLDISGEKKTARRPFRAEKNVRYYFRRLMIYGEKCGLNMRDGILTSDEVEKRESSAWGKEDELSELRTLYLSSRYGSGKESDADKNRAKEICNDIMKG